ncbi:MAG: EAL domain-containing protein [Spirochaetaceae bacterium]
MIRGELETAPNTPEILSSFDGSKNSLFDGLLREFIRECHFEIDSDTEEGTNLQIIMENTPDSVIELDSEGTILSANPSFTKTFLYRESELREKSFFSLVSEEYHSGLKEGMQRASKENLEAYLDSVNDIIVFRAGTKDGQNKSLEGLFYSYQRDGKPRLLLLIRDLTYSRSLFDELKEAKNNYDALSETISETIIRLDEDFVVLFVNSAVKKTFGYDRKEVQGQHFSLLFPPGVFARNAAHFKKYFFVDDQHRQNLGLAMTIEGLGQSKNRGVFPMEMSFGNSKEYEGRTMTCILRDITQRKHNERKLRHLAYHDKLTGLGNRDLFNNDIRTLLGMMRKRAGTISALMFLDLDGFKQVNDTLGHEAGDKLLLETARRLRSSLRETDSVYRFGGDEFVVLLNTIQEPANAGSIAAKLLGAIRQPYTIEQEGSSTTVSVGVSIGIALAPEHGSTQDTLTKNADLAMYSAKEAGKNQYHVYSEEMDRKAIEKWEFEQGLRNGLTNHEFVLHFQPLVRGDGAIRGVEALIRWNHPDWGIVSPNRFIPAAEESGLIMPLGKWILETACRKIHYLNSRGFPNLFVSVNISPQQFEHPEFLSNTGRVIRRTGINPKNLTFELTETSIMTAPELAIKKMNALKEHHPGITLAIDDFGTGYSSLGYLSKLPADIIKIDLSFVSQLFSLNNEKVVNAIINLAKSLDMGIIAEGVESREQLDYFVQRGCSLLQGHYFYRSMQLKELVSVLRNDSNARKERARLSLSTRDE